MHIEAAIDAVISAFIRNPEISSIQYIARQNIIEIEMIIKENIDPGRNRYFCQKTKAALQMLHKLRENESKYMGIELNNHGNITILTLLRDAFTLTEEEIDLYVKMAGLEFSSMLLREDDENALLNTRVNDIKKQLLKRFNQKNNFAHNIFAYRNGGKMFVFDK